MAHVYVMTAVMHHQGTVLDVYNKATDLGGLGMEALSLNHLSLPVGMRLA